MKEFLKNDKLRIVRRYYFEKIHASKLKREEGVSTDELSAWIHKYIGEIRQEKQTLQKEQKQQE